MASGFCKFDCTTYQRGCAGSSNGYTKDCEKYDPEPQYYLITPQDLDDIYRGDSDSSSSAYEETRKHPYHCGDDCKGECSGEVDGVVHCPHQSVDVLDELEKKRFKYDQNLKNSTSCFDEYDRGLIEGKECFVIILKEWIEELRDKGK